MFNDGRSKRVAFLAHCLLNQNAISDGTAVYPAAFKSTLQVLLKEDIGVVQLPCPELCCLGLDRGDEYGAERPVTVENTRIRREMSEGKAANRLAALVDYTMYQIEEYHRHGFELTVIVGVDRSPNCGVNTTSDSGIEVPGMGLYMSALKERIETAGICIPILGLKSDKDGVEKLLNILKNK